MVRSNKRMRPNWMLSPLYRGVTRQIKHQGNLALLSRYMGATDNRYRAALKIGRFMYMNRSKLPFNKLKTLLNRRTAPGAKVQSKSNSNSPPAGSNSFTLGTLTLNDFPWPARGSDGSNFRDSNVIFVKGISICRQFEYDAFSGATALNGNADIGPITVHWCLLQLKNDEGTGEIGQEITQDFFRDNSVDSRTRGFLNSTATSVWDMGKNCLPLNPNDKVRILTHKRRTLIARGGGQNNTSKGSFWTIRKYYKLKKRMTFRGANSAFPNQRIFEAFWYETKGPSQYPSVPNAYNGITQARLNQIYFKDT